VLTFHTPVLRGVMELKSRAGGTKFDFIFQFGG
jgi:hypothetical protein